MEEENVSWNFRDQKHIPKELLNTFHKAVSAYRAVRERFLTSVSRLEAGFAHQEAINKKCNLVERKFYAAEEALKKYMREDARRIVERKVALYGAQLAMLREEWQECQEWDVDEKECEVAREAKSLVEAWNARWEAEEACNAAIKAAQGEGAA